MVARPSGAATTLSAPLRMTTAPSARAAARARASLPTAPSTSSRPRNSRANSPSCGVMTTGAQISPASVAESPAKLVSASASSTTLGRLAAVKAARAQPRVASPTPAPGPMRTALRLTSASNSAKPASPSKGATMTAVSCPALTATASSGLASVTSPAPARNAARAASRAAPVWAAPPDSTSAAPRAYLCDWAPSLGSAAPQTLG